MLEYKPRSQPAVLLTRRSVCRGHSGRLLSRNPAAMRQTSPLRESSWAARFKNCRMRLVTVHARHPFSLGLIRSPRWATVQGRMSPSVPPMQPTPPKRLYGTLQPRRRCLGCGQMIRQMAGQNTADMAPYCAAAMFLVFYFPRPFGFRPELRRDTPRDDLIVMIGCTGPPGKMALQMGASHTRWLSLLRQRDAGNTRMCVYTPYIKLPLSASS